MNNFDENDIIWEEFETKSGKKYRVGYQKEESLKKENFEGGLKRVPFDINVNWPVTESTAWIDTSSEVREKAAIWRYKLYKTDDYIYKYKLWFTNSDHYDYVFYDESGDSYNVNTFLNRDHYVEYNSDYPNIIRITGE
ncbi:hypothetical protein [Bacillus cereus]|uniref:hypothetical protein n=1 Tax=Bacillus cereus TaxID=1396 RepID=UPI002349CE9E|nr:hypothetical protein [Bacillus cereus]